MSWRDSVNKDDFIQNALQSNVIQFKSEKKPNEISLIQEIKNFQMRRYEVG